MSERVAEKSLLQEEVQKTPMRTGIAFFLVSESFIFIALFATYYYLRLYTTQWPSQSIIHDTTLASINTAFLLSSSLTIYLGLRSIRRGNRKGLLYGLLATIILGSTFLGITAYEWTNLSFQPWSNAYGSIFFTLTGFHALHVFGGVILMVALFIRSARNRFSKGNHLAVEIGSYYWHYVDMIWIFVFTTLFIIR